jgi:urease accessory protein
MEARHSPGTPPAPLRVSEVLGRMGDDDWPARLRRSQVDVLQLDQAEAQRSRLRKRTEGGTDVAIALERGAQLRDGDVLGWDEAGQTAVVARVDLADVMIVDLSPLLDGSAETLLARSVEVGHALGNQHWPALVKGAQVYVPLTVAREVMSAVLKTHQFDGVSYGFVPGAEVLPYLAPHEARLLFAGASGRSSLRAGPGDEERR